MPVVLDKTWIIDSNNAGGGVSAVADHRSLLLAIKDSLVFGPNPQCWNTVGSSNSVFGAMDAVDRWAAAANLVWAKPGDPHSWIVLETDGGFVNQVCIDLTPLDTGSTQGPLISVYISTAGFAGGDASNRPVAVDEVTVLNGAQWCGTDSTTPAFNWVWHHWHADDGPSDRVVIHVNNVPVSFWLFDGEPQFPNAAWATPFIACISAGTALGDSAATYTKLWANPAAKALVAAAHADLYFVSEGWAGQGAGQRLQVANDLDSLWPFFSIAFASETVGARGRLTGYDRLNRGCWDLWFGSTAIGEGDTYPAGAARDFVQFGHLVFPWDGSVPVTA
jgi:hypothetical protein